MLNSGGIIELDLSIKKPRFSIHPILYCLMTWTMERYHNQFGQKVWVGVLKDGLYQGLLSVWLALSLGKQSITITRGSAMIECLSTHHFRHF